MFGENRMIVDQFLLKVYHNVTDGRTESMIPINTLCRADVQQEIIFNSYVFLR